METIKKELTVKNIIGVLGKQDVTIIDKFDVDKWHLLIDNLLNEFFENKTKNRSKRPYGIPLNYRGFCEFNKKYENIWVDNFNRITFKFLYPNIIIKLLDEGKIKFNIEELGILYKFLVLNYNNVKDLFNIDKEKCLWKVIMNSMFGASKFWKALFYYFQFVDDNIIYNKNDEVDDLVTHYTETIFNKILYKYSNDIITIQTDQIYYISDIDSDFYNELDKLGIKYYIDYNYEGIFKGKHNYLIQDKTNKKIIRDSIHRKK